MSFGRPNSSDPGSSSPTPDLQAQSDALAPISTPTAPGRTSTGDDIPRAEADSREAEGSDAGEPSSLAGFFREHAVDRSRLSRPLRWVVNLALVQIVTTALLVAAEALGLPAGLWLPILALVLGVAGCASVLFDPRWPGLPVGGAIQPDASRRPGTGETLRWRSPMPISLPRPVPGAFLFAARLSLGAGAAALLLSFAPLLVGTMPQHLVTLGPGTTVPVLAVLAAAFFLLVAESLVLAGASVARWPMRLPVVTLSVGVLGALAVPSLQQAATSEAVSQRAAVGTQCALLVLLWVLGCWGVPLFMRLARTRGLAERMDATGPLPVLWWGYLFGCLVIYYAAFTVGLAATGGGRHAAAVVASLQTLLGLEAFWFVVLPVLFLAGTDFAEMGIVAAHSAHHLLNRLSTWRRDQDADSWVPAVLLVLTLLAALHGTVVLGNVLGQERSGRVLSLVLLVLAAVVAVGGIAGVAVLARRKRRPVVETVPYWSLFATSVAFAVYAGLSVVSLVTLSAPFLLAAAFAVACGLALVLLGPRARGLVGRTGPTAGVFLVTWGALVPLVLWTARMVGVGEELGASDYLAVVVEVSALQVMVGVAAAVGLPLLASATGWRRLRAAVHGPVLPIFILQAGLQVVVWMAGIYHSAEGASDQVGWARALILGVALLWDALLCGSQITNVVGHRFPRAARVPIYYGFLIGVSTMVFYFASWRLGADAVQSGINFQLYLSTERYPMIGLALFGVPMLVTGAVVALLLRERPEEAAARPVAIGEAEWAAEGAEAARTAPPTRPAPPESASPEAVPGEAAVLPAGMSFIRRTDQEAGATAIPASPDQGPRAPLGMRGLVVCGLGVLVAAVVLGSAVGVLAIGRGPAAPIGSVRLGLDVGYDAHGQPVVVGPRTVFASGDSFGFVAAVAAGRTFNTTSLTMVVDTRGARGAVTQITAQPLPAQPQWTAHAYRLNPIDTLMGTCRGTQFTFVLRDNGAELGAANFTYTGCGHPASGVRGHLVFGAGSHAGADGVTTFIDRPATTFASGNPFTIVVVTSAPLASQDVTVVVLQRAADGTPHLIYVQRVVVSTAGQASSFALSITPIDGLMANCNPTASQTYDLEIGVGSGRVASGTFVYTGCGTAS